MDLNQTAEFYLASYTDLAGNAGVLVATDAADNEDNGRLFGVRG